MWFKKKEEESYSYGTLRRIATTKGVIREITPSASWFKGDRALWIIVAVLAVISVLVVYSSTAKMAYDNAAIKSTSQFLQGQIGSLILAAVLILVVANFFSARFFMGFAWWGFWISLLLTVAVYFMGQSTNGAARWISIFGFQFQPSEALKVATIMVLARTLAKRKDVIDDIILLPTKSPFEWGTPGQISILRNGFVPVAMPMFISCIIVAPSHISSAMLLFITSTVMLIIGRVPWRQLFRLIMLFVICGATYIIIGAGRSDTASGRVSTWIESWTSDRTGVAAEDLTDTERSMIAIYNGGLTGVGAGKSAMRVEMIHPESDYAYAFFIEEYGSLMAILMLMLYLWIFIRAIHIFDRCSTTFPALLVLGLAMMITCQALLHVAVTLNIIPETGQTLPLISRGGSSLIFNAIALGMILCISRQNDEREAA